MVPRPHPNAPTDPSPLLSPEADALKKENSRLRAEAERVKQIRRAEANQKFAEFEAKKQRAERQARREKARRPT